MLRVAVCLSAHMRTFERTWPNLRDNIVEPNNADLFLATYDITGNAKHNFSDTADFQEPLDVQRVERTYGSRLASMKVFDFKSVQESLPKLFFPGMMSMFFMVKQADELRRSYEAEHGFMYDVIIRTRPDIMFDTGFKIDDVSGWENTIWVTGRREHYVTDWFALGRRVPMMIYAALYDLLPDYQLIRDQLTPPPGETCVFYPEQVLKLHCERFNLRAENFPVRAALCRDERWRQ